MNSGDTSGVGTRGGSTCKPRELLTKGHKREGNAVSVTRAFPFGRAEGLFCLISCGNRGYYIDADVGRCGRIAEEKRALVILDFHNPSAASPSR